MSWHLTARLAWHDDGWNGHICSAPQKNTYCVGAHSYPGEMISERRDLEWEKSCAGKSCSGLDTVPPCIYSMNAFGTQALKSFAEPPAFFNKEAKRLDWALPPATVCVWPYEEMYRDEVKQGAHYDSRARKNTQMSFCEA